MARVRWGSVVVALALVVAMTGCSSSKKSASSTTSSSAGVSVTTSAASSTVTVVLSDTSGVTGPMTMTATPSTMKAGDITFVVKNEGTIEHEVVVLPLPAGVAYDKLPIDQAGDPPAPVTTGADKISEEGSLGETGDPALEAGMTRSFTVKDMPAGNYVLVCNIADHYKMGMETAFTVT